MKTWEQRLREAEADLFASATAEETGADAQVQVTKLRESLASVLGVTRELAAFVLPGEPDIP